MLEPGATVPPFEGTDQHGGRWTSDSLRGRPYILYFYPKAGSLGCTRETHGFEGLVEPLGARGIALLGVSEDPPPAQARFAEQCQVTFPLVADVTGDVARKFGVLGMFRMARRVTFFVGEDGKILEVVQSPLPGVHLRRVRDRFLASGGPAETVQP